MPILRNALIAMTTIVPCIAVADQAPSDYNGAYSICKSATAAGCGPTNGVHFDYRPVLAGLTATPVQDGHWTGVPVDISKPMAVRVIMYDYTVVDNNYNQIEGDVERGSGGSSKSWLLLKKTRAQGGRLYQVKIYLQDISNLWPEQVRRLKPSAEGYVTLSEFKFAPQVY